MKLLKRLIAIEKNMKPNIRWPHFSMVYETEEVYKNWFEKHNPFYNFHEFIKDKATLESYYEDSGESEVRKIKRGCEKSAHRIIEKYNIPAVIDDGSNEW